MFIFVIYYMIFWWKSLSIKCT